MLLFFPFVLLGTLVLVENLLGLQGLVCLGWEGCPHLGSGFWVSGFGVSGSGAEQEASSILNDVYGLGFCV